MLALSAHPCYRASMRKLLALISCCGALVLGLGACIAPATNAQRLMEIARDLNLSTRFGRMEVAVGAVSPKSRGEFLKRHATWGGLVRVVDVDLVGMDVNDQKKTAKVDVDVAWVRMNEGTLRTTRVNQTWQLQERGWRLTKESRASGDLGLFGEAVELRQSPPEDRQFATRRLNTVVEGD